MLRKRLHWHHIRIPVHAKKTEESQSETTPSAVTKKAKWAKLESKMGEIGQQFRPFWFAKQPNSQNSMSWNIGNEEVNEK
ncbi:hypothetical protein [Prevotella koreensis]|uniref:hypothetical protein n=1 Tax=Prevotella koreensis TaxID=2490854 RepID=UPI003F9EF770